MATRKTTAKAKTKAKATKAKASKVKAAPKKAATKAKAAPKKAAPKKAATKTKAAPKKAAPKKAATKAKAAPKKAAQKKAATKAKAAPKKAAPKKAATKAKTTPKKKAAPSKTAAKTKAAPKKPTVTAVKKSSEGQLQDFTPYQPKRGEEYMNDEQKEHFRQILLNWRNDLMEEVDRTVHHMQDEAANPPDPADRATLEEEFSIELRTRDRERRLIKKIDSTIELIANDDYGWCDSCGVEIGIRRLEARPTANKCIDCKTLDEIKEKQLGA